jgi:dihydrodipicolinate synthase/N-acetylneuraminate lyase
MLYDIPAFAGVQLGLDMVKRFANHKSACGFKDTRADLDRFLELIATLRNHLNFYLLQGKEHLLAERLIAAEMSKETILT